MGGIDGADVLGRKWYADGLHFSCQQCGRCCTGEPGYVWVSRVEVGLIAKFMKVSEDDLRAKHIRRVGLRVSLTEMPNGDCTFLKDGKEGRGCEIYSVRPLQCRTWPFWNLNLRSQNSWNQAATTCLGMNKDQLHSFEQIEAQRTRKKWW